MQLIGQVVGCWLSALRLIFGMTYRSPPTPALPLDQALALFEKSLADALQDAITAGVKGQGAAQAAKRASERVNVALQDVRRSERAQARLHSINGLNAHLAGALHSANARGNIEVDWPTEIKAAFEALRKATW